MAEPASWASSPAVRRSMQGNRSRDTRPELALRRALRALGVRGYRVCPRVAETRPDLAFVGRRVAVFVDGCFWHGCPADWKAPGTNAEYWMPKIERNRARDGAANAALREAGWTVIRVWEHQAAEGAAEMIAAWLGR